MYTALIKRQEARENAPKDIEMVSERVPLSLRIPNQPQCLIKSAMGINILDHPGDADWLIWQDFEKWMILLGRVSGECLLFIGVHLTIETLDIITF